MSKKSNQDDSEELKRLEIEFKKLETLWKQLFNRMYGYPDDWDEYKKLQPMWADLFNQMKGHIREQGNSNKSYWQKIQALEEQLQKKQEEIQQLQKSLNELNETNEQLEKAHNEIVRELTKWKRDTTAVYSSGVSNRPVDLGVSYQPVDLEREYCYLIDQDVANYIRRVLKYLRDEASIVDVSTNRVDIRNKIQSILTMHMFCRNSEDKMSIDFISELICGDINIAYRPFPENLNTELGVLLQRGQALVDIIIQSGGDLVFYKDELFNQDFHELASGSSTTGTVIQYTVSPAYIVKSVPVGEVLDQKVMVKAKVVTGDSHSANQT